MSDWIFNSDKAGLKRKRVSKPNAPTFWQCKALITLLHKGYAIILFEKLYYR